MEEENVVTLQDEVEKLLCKNSLQKIIDSDYVQKSSISLTLGLMLVPIIIALLFLIVRIFKFKNISFRRKILNSISKRSLFGVVIVILLGLAIGKESVRPIGESIYNDIATLTKENPENPLSIEQLNKWGMSVEDYVQLRRCVMQDISPPSMDEEFIEIAILAIVYVLCISVTLFYEIIKTFPENFKTSEGSVIVDALMVKHST